MYPWTLGSSSYYASKTDHHSHLHTHSNILSFHSFFYCFVESPKNNKNIKKKRTLPLFYFSSTPNSETKRARTQRFSRHKYSLTIKYSVPIDNPRGRYLSICRDISLKPSSKSTVRRRIRSTILDDGTLRVVLSQSIEARIQPGKRRRRRRRKEERIPNTSSHFFFFFANEEQDRAIFEVSLDREKDTETRDKRRRTPRHTRTNVTINKIRVISEIRRIQN